MPRRRRRYRDARGQAIYDGYVEAFDSGRRGWFAPMRHGLWREDGSEFRGASGASAFWNGYHGLTLSGGRALYSRGTANFYAYMAGRDCAPRGGSE